MNEDTKSGGVAAEGSSLQVEVDGVERRTMVEG